MQLSPFPCHLDHLRSKYFPQHLILKHPQPAFLPQCQNSSICFFFMLYSSYTCNRIVFCIITLSHLLCTMVLRRFTYVHSCTEVWHHLAACDSSQGYGPRPWQFSGMRIRFTASSSPMALQIATLSPSCLEKLTPKQCRHFPCSPVAWLTRLPHLPFRYLDYLTIM